MLLLVFPFMRVFVSIKKFLSIQITKININFFCCYIAVQFSFFKNSYTVFFITQATAAAQIDCFRERKKIKHLLNVGRCCCCWCCCLVGLMWVDWCNVRLFFITFLSAAKETKNKFHFIFCWVKKLCVNKFYENW